MNTYQLLNSRGLVLGTVNADTRSEAVEIAHTIWNTNKITAVLA